MDSYLQDSCDVPFFLQILEGLLFLFFVGFFFEGDDFLGGEIHYLLQ